MNDYLMWGLILVGLQVLAFILWPGTAWITWKIKKIHADKDSKSMMDREAKETNKKIRILGSGKGRSFDGRGPFPDDIGKAKPRPDLEDD